MREQLQNGTHATKHLSFEINHLSNSTFPNPLSRRVMKSTPKRKFRRAMAGKSDRSPQKQWPGTIHTWLLLDRLNEPRQPVLHIFSAKTIQCLQKISGCLTVFPCTIDGKTDRVKLQDIHPENIKLFKRLLERGKY